MTFDEFKVEVERQAREQIGTALGTVAMDTLCSYSRKAYKAASVTAGINAYGALRIDRFLRWCEEHWAEYQGPRVDWQAPRVLLQEGAWKAVAMVTKADLTTLHDQQGHCADSHVHHVTLGNELILTSLHDDGVSQGNVHAVDVDWFGKKHPTDGRVARDHIGSEGQGVGYDHTYLCADEPCVCGDTPGRWHYGLDYYHTYGGEPRIVVDGRTYVVISDHSSVTVMAHWMASVTVVREAARDALGRYAVRI